MEPGILNKIRYVRARRTIGGDDERAHREGVRPGWCQHKSSPFGLDATKPTLSHGSASLRGAIFSIARRVNRVSTDVDMICFTMTPGRLKVLVYCGVWNSTKPLDHLINLKCPRDTPSNHPPSQTRKAHTVCAHRKAPVQPSLTPHATPGVLARRTRTHTSIASQDPQRKIARSQ